MQGIGALGFQFADGLVSVAALFIWEAGVPPLAKRNVGRFVLLREFSGPLQPSPAVGTFPDTLPGVPGRMSVLLVCGFRFVGSKQLMRKRDEI